MSLPLRVPLPAWIRHYRGALLAGDLSAGVVVAMMMVPQAMAYAIVAGLPPVAGLYASIVPAFLYALFGTSMTQSVGPMAIISLMTASMLAPLAPAGSGLHGVLAAQLALMAGAVLLLAALLRVGFLANFFSRPVMSGFTLGSALLIAWGQVGALLGTGAVPPWRAHIAPASAALGLGALLLLMLAKRYCAPLLVRAGVPAGAAHIVARLAPMLVVIAATALVMADAGGAGGIGGGKVATIGAVPAGLPTLNLALAPQYFRPLLQPALLIGFMIFLISMSSSQALARVNAVPGMPPKPLADFELAGLGLANIGSAFSGGLPVTGSMSRAAVNVSAGANTPLAGVISAVLLAGALVGPTGYLANVPLPVLAATIILAVLGMLELDTLRTALRYDRSDALALLGTAAGVLFAGVEAGVVIGVLLSMGTLIWRASRPHIAVLGRIGGSEHFRNVERHPGETAPTLLLLRVDAFLFFGNMEAVAARIDHEVAARAQLRDLVLVLSAVNAIDTSALFGLADINRDLKARGIALHLAEVKGPVMDRLHTVKLLDELGGRVFLSTANAWDALASTA